MNFFALLNTWSSRIGRTLKSAVTQRLPSGASYRSRSQRRGQGHVWAWLLSLAALITTVTIASIPSRQAPALKPINDLVATPPKQLLAIAGLKGNVTDYLPTPAERMLPAGPAGNDAISEAQTLRIDGKEGWIYVTVRRGDTLTHILNRNNVNGNDIGALIMADSQSRTPFYLYPGHNIKLRVDASRRLNELEYKLSEAETLHVKREGNTFKIYKESREFETRLAYISGIIESSLYEAGHEAGLADALIMRLVDIFGWDIDFVLDLRQGDSFSVIHEENYWLGQKVGDGRILAAEFVNKKKAYRAIAHRGKNGFTSYYTPTGLSMHKEFLRTPVKFSRISSRFSTGRYHPILKRWRRHTGVDYAAPTGTPVRATAAGRILLLGRKGGYGKTVIIKHGGNYGTLYAHLSRYDRTVRAGSYVEQGQIIGYVGSTGLATGPHLHYEFQVNGVHRNPLTFRFPRAKSIQPDYLEDFLPTASSWSGILDLMERQTIIASSQ